MWYRPLGKAGRSGAELSRRSTDVVAFLSKSADELPLGTCLIIDISEDGAPLRIEKPADVPDPSVLLLSPRGRSFRRCRMVPRQAYSSRNKDSTFSDRTGLLSLAGGGAGEAFLIERNVGPPTHDLPFCCCGLRISSRLLHGRFLARCQRAINRELFKLVALLEQ